MDSLQLLTLYLTLTTIFSGRKAKINLHTTPKSTVVIPISCLLPCADPEIFVGGGGGGGEGPRQSDKKALTALFVCFFFFFFFVLGLVYRSQMVNFKEKVSFFKVPRGSKFFQGGSNFFQGGGGPIAYSLKKPDYL